MNKYLITVLFLLGLNLIARAQTGKVMVTGTLCDSSSRKGIAYLDFNVYSDKAKSTQKVLCNSAGVFSFSLADTGRYTLSVNSSLYKHYTKTIHVRQALLQLDTILVSSKTIALKAVEIKSYTPVRRVNDTIVFDTRAFTYDINSFSKNLFKELPGMTVSRTGQVLFYGEQITKVLVDGEPFFENGPATAMEFLRSGAISKVNVYYENKKRVVNIILKPNAKRGYFGGFESLAGEKDVFGLQGTLNLFNKKTRLGASGLTSTLGNSKLNWTDPKTVELNHEIFNRIEALPAFLQEGSYFKLGDGVPHTLIGNLFYSNKWNRSKIIVDYHRASAKTTSEYTITQKNLLPEIATSSDISGINEKNKNGQTLSVGYEIFPWKNATLKVNSQNFTGDYQSQLNSVNASYDKDRILINDQTLNQLANGHEASTDNTVSLAQTLNHKSNFYFNFKQFYSQKKGSLLTNSISRLNKQGIFSVDTLNLDKQATTEEWNHAVTLIYKIKFIKNISLSTELSGGNNLNKASILTYRIQNNVGVLDRALSNELTYENKYAVVRPSLEYTIKKGTLLFGARYIYNSYLQSNVSASSQYKEKYSNWSPYIILDLNFPRNKNLNIDYVNNPIRPAYYQKQAIQQNADPMNVFIGNPDLKQGYEHRFNVRYMTLDYVKNRSLSFNLVARVLNNAIAANTIIDTFNRRLTQYINVNGNYNIGGNAQYSLNSKSRNIQFDISPAINFNQNVNVINGQKNINKNLFLQLSPHLTVNTNAGWGLDLSNTVSYNNNHNNLNSTSNLSYFMHNYTLGMSKTLFTRLTVSSESTLQIEPQNSLFTRNNSYLLCNLSLSLSLLKHEQLTMSLQGNDLLNQKTYFNKFANNYLLNEEYFSGQKRYVMLRIYYKIANKIGKREAVY